MFEAICIREHRDTREPIDLGLLAEALLFYRSVRIILDLGSLRQLARALGPDLLVEYIDSRRVTFSYLQGLPTVVTRNDRFHASRTVLSPKFELGYVAPFAMTEAFGNSDNARRAADRIIAATETIDPMAPDVRWRLGGAWDNPAYVLEAVKRTIRRLAPNYPDINSVRFDLPRHGTEFEVATNLNFALLDKLHHGGVMPPKPTITPLDLLNKIDIAAELFFAARYDSEFAVDPVKSDLIQLYMGQAMSRARSEGAQGRFQDFVFDDGRAVAAAITTGARSFRDLLQLLDRADKFRRWLHGVSPDRDAVKEYFREVTRDTWADSLPVKLLRWVLFTALSAGAEVVGGPIAGMAVGGIDAFLIEHLMKGWKPDQFVRTHLQQFVDGRRSTPEG